MTPQEAKRFAEQQMVKREVTSCRDTAFLFLTLVRTYTIPPEDLPDTMEEANGMVGAITQEWNELVKEIYRDHPQKKGENLREYTRRINQFLLLRLCDRLRKELRDAGVGGE